MPRITTFFANLPTLAKYLLLSASGLLAVFALAPFYIFPLYSIGLIILIVALDDAKKLQSSKRAAFARAFTFAFFHFALGMFWVGQAFLVDAEKFAWLLPFAITALPGFLALYYGIMGILYVRFSSNSFSRIFWFAACFSITEYIRGHAFTGIPWNLSTYIFEAGGAISQGASIFGPFGLGAIIVLLSVSPIVFNDKFGKLTLAICGFVGVSLFSFGAYRIAANSNSTNTGIVVATAQAGLSQKELWNSENKDKVFEIYLNQLKTKQAQSANLIVWPEGTFPTEFFSENELLQSINPLIKNKVLIVGAPRADIVGDKITYFNSLVWVTGSQEKYPQLLAIYDKNHLVPFGEYLPFRKLFNSIGIESLVAYGTDFSKSAGPKTIRIAGLPTMEPRICYEIIFPRFGTNANNANIIINSSVDAWYGDFLGPDQHYNQARYRAIEEGKPLIRSAAGGWSGIIDALGRPVRDFRKGNQIVTSFIPSSLELPIYSRWGDWVYFLLIVAFIAISFHYYREY